MSDVPSELLDALGRSGERLVRLGGGGESNVYALDDTRVLRVLHGTASGLGRKALCDELASDALPFRIPRVLDEGTVGKTSYTVEERIAGRSFDRMLPELSGERRERALVAYADAADALRCLNGSRPWFGEVARPGAIRSDSWNEFLALRAKHAIAREQNPIRGDVAHIETILARFVETVGDIDGIQPGMVHADYFPANVMMTDDLAVSGVIDFGVMTMYGDHRLDLVSSVGFFAQQNQWYQPGDAEVLGDYMTGLVPSFSDVFDVYRTYYALYFSYCRDEDARLYAWCVDVLRSHAASR